MVWGLRRRALMTVMCLAGTSVAMAAPSPSPATQPAPLAATIDQILKRLDSDSFTDRESAANEVDQLPLEALPLLQAAAKKAGISPDLRTALLGPINRLQNAAGKQSRYLAAVDFYRAQLAGEYDRVGVEDPAWDEPAKRLLEETAKAFAARMLHRPTSPGVIDAADAVRKTKTTDPLLRYLALRFQSPTPLKPLIDLWPAMQASQYAPYRKASHAGLIVEIASQGASPQKRDRYDARKYLAAAAEQWPAVLRDESFPRSLAARELVFLLDAAHNAGVDRKEAFEILDAPLAKQLGEEDLIRLNLRGSYYVALATEQRAGPGELTWELANKSLEQAEKILTRCYELYPDDVNAPLTMLSIEAQQGRGLPFFDKWFDRAIKADPENVEAYQKKFDYLDPASFGSNGEHLAFARKCLESGHFETRIPLMVVAAHKQVDMPPPWGSIEPNPYYAQDDVWPDISAAYEGFLRYHPDAADDRAAYAELAWRAGKWSAAAEQYRVLSQAPDWAKRNTGLVRLIQLELPIRLADPQPRPDRIAIAEKRDREDAATLRRLFVDSYEGFGRKSFKWDEPARATLAAATRAWSGDPDRTWGENDIILKMGRSAIDGGCDDPLVRFIYHYTLDMNVTPRKPSANVTCMADADALLSSDYPEFVRADVMLHAIGCQLLLDRPNDKASKAEMLKRFDLVVPLLDTAAREQQQRPEYIALTAGRMIKCLVVLGGDETSYYERLRDVFEKAKFQPAALKDLRAYYLYEHAQAARSQRGAQREAGVNDNAEYRKRAADAEAFCEQLWQEQPARRESIWELMNLASAAHDDERLKFWFRQAVLVDPHNRANAEVLVRAMSRESDIGHLAHAAAETHAYRTQLPFMLVDYHVRLASLTEPGQPLADLPDVDRISDDDTWQDIAGVFESYLAKYPDDSDRRSEYASLACRAGKWVTAIEQMRLLGDHVRPKAFVTTERLAACQKKIAAFNAITSQPATP